MSVLWAWGIIHYFQYTHFVEWLGQKYHFSSSQEMTFRQKLLPPSRFQWLKILLISVPLLLASFTFLLVKTKKLIQNTALRILQEASQVYKNLWITWQQLHKNQKILTYFTFACLVVLRIFYLSHTPFHIDEISTFLFFTQKGVLVSASYYPNPNNHIFYTLLTCLSSQVFPSAELAIKMPSVVASWLGILLFFFILLKKYKHYYLAILGAILWASVPSLVLYGSLGRGYSLQIFFLLIAFYSHEQLLQKRATYFYSFLFILANSLATYTIPSYVYVLGGFLVWSLIFPLSQKVFWWTYSSIFLLVLLLYTPIILFNDFQEISASDWATKLPLSTFLSQVWAYFFQVNEFIWGWEVTGGMIGIVLLWILPYRKKKAIYLYFLLGSLPILLWQMAFPPVRIWIFLIVPILWQLFLFLANTQYQKIFIGILVSYILFASYINYQQCFQWQEYEAVESNLKHISLKSNTNIFTNNYTYNAYLRWQIHQQKLTNTHIDVNWDSQKQYEWLFLLPQSILPPPNQYDLYKKDEYVEVYRKR